MIFSAEFMEPLFMTLEQCKGVKQDRSHHPEGDVFVHSLQVLYVAFRETIDTDLILAAMMHDVGKMDNSHGHEKIAIDMLKPYLSVKSLWLVENHMRIWYYLLGHMKKLSKAKELSEHPWLPELVQLARFDKLGRNPSRKIIYDKDEIMSKLNLCVEKHWSLERSSRWTNYMMKNQNIAQHRMEHLLDTAQNGE